MKRKALEIAFELFARFNASQCSALNRRYGHRYIYTHRHSVRNVGAKRKVDGTGLKGV